MKRSELKAALREVERDLRDLRDPAIVRTLAARRRELRDQLAALGSYVGRKCHECERTRPDEETTLVSGLIGGDYRRASRRGQVRVCVDCTTEHIEYVRKSQAENLNVPVNSGRIAWAYAADAFGISIEGLFIETGGRRIAPTASEALTELGNARSGDDVVALIDRLGIGGTSS